MYRGNIFVAGGKNKIPVYAALTHSHVTFREAIDVELVRETASKNHSGRILKSNFPQPDPNLTGNGCSEYHFLTCKILQLSRVTFL